VRFRRVNGVDEPGDFSDELETWLKSDGPKTLEELGNAFAEKSFAVTILLLMFVPALPLPTGGVTHVFEIFAVLVALQMVLGRRTIWMPKKWKQRELGATITGKGVPFVIRRVRWFEKFSRPRLAGLFQQRWFMRVLGLVIIAFTIFAFVAPPFSSLDTLPALGVVAICLAIILEDVVILGIGIVIGTGGAVLIVTIGAAIARFLKDRF
jgi:hypothetical protein